MNSKRLVLAGAMLLVVAAGEVAWSQSFGFGGRMGTMGGHFGRMGDGRMGTMPGQGAFGGFRGGFQNVPSAQAGPGFEMMKAPGMGPGMGPTVDFAAADANGDGKVTPEELASWQASQVASIDTNGDGKLSADEISHYELALLATWTQAQAQSMVKELDTNGDGLLSAAELLARPMTEAGFSQLDRNHDGVLSGSELQGAPIGSAAPGSFGSYPQYGPASAAAHGMQGNGTSTTGN